jgi:glycosyl transferase family 25
MINVDKVLYINLLDRTDRRENIENTLGKVFSPNKIMRLNAIKYSPGYIGAIKSHIACLEIAIENNWTVLIVEDDMEWNGIPEIKSLQKIMLNPYDVIILGGTFPIYNPKTFKLYQCNSGTSYIVSRDYCLALKNNFVSALEKLISTHNYKLYALDIYWHKLQKKDNWFIVYPPLCIQKTGYSDIDGKISNPTKYFFICNNAVYFRRYKKKIISISIFLTVVFFLMVFFKL